MKVIATRAGTYVPIKELKRPARPNEVFEVSEERFKYLNGNNQFHIKFVEAVIEPVVEPVVEPIVEKVVEPVKKKKPTRKKKVNEIGSEGKE